MESGQQGARAATAATLCASAMIANQVAGKAARDALFLSHFDVSFLPFMLIGSALVSMALVVVGSRLLSRHGPATLVPPAFFLSACLLLGEWALLRSHARVATVLLYVHVAGLGGVLISGFWSFVNERFDPRTAKRQIGRIGAGATLGGLVGGVLAERIAATMSVPAMIPILAALHVFCGMTVFGMGRVSNLLEQLAEDVGVEAGGGPGEGNAFRMLRQAPYLRNMAILLLLVTMSGGMLDYVFKARAAQAYENGEDLLRFFAIFYTLVAFGTFLVQTLLSGRALERLGVARTITTLPLAVAAGAVGAVAVPGLAGAAAAKGLESVTNDSLFRSGYEILFTPIPAREKRATKSVVDVGFQRLGDLAAGGMIRLMLQVIPGIVIPAALAFAALVGAAGAWFCRRLHQGYVVSLERGLLNRAIELDMEDVHDSTTRSTVLRSIQMSQNSSSPASSRRSVTTRSIRKSYPASPWIDGSSVAATAPGHNGRDSADPVVRAVALLRSGDLAAIRQFLGAGALRGTVLVPQVIALLAWDEASGDAINALRLVEARATGQLTDALLDPGQPFAVRRRVPRVLAASRSPRAVEGLLEGLSDSRFEVRYRCAAALKRVVRENPQLLPPADRIYAVVKREAAVDKKIWEGRKLLDVVEDSDSPIDALLRNRANRSLEHVFRLLSLILPEGPLNMAFRGLHAEDASLRGIALEYLETVLPAGVRELLWPYLEDDRTAKTAVRTPEEILDALVRSHQSIELELALLQRK